MGLIEFFIKYPKVAIAFSGGVDSSYLAYAANRYAEEVRLYYVKSAFQPKFEHEDATRLADELGMKMTSIFINVLEEEAVTANPKDRCYHCKNRIFSKILEQAHEDGFDVILDGTNASDDAEDRPGMKALKEMKVLSPLRLCGLTKNEIRILSKEAGLFTWNKPAYACLATRIPIGDEITEYKLRRTENAEGFMASLGFRDFRVRTIENSAKIQITEKQMGLLVENRAKIFDKLKEDYDSVYLDMEVRDEQ